MHHINTFTDYLCIYTDGAKSDERTSSAKLSENHFHRLPWCTLVAGGPWTWIKPRIIGPCPPAQADVQNINIKLTWIPSHARIEGNEIVDKIAKKALNNNIINCTIKLAVGDNINKWIFIDTQVPPRPTTDSSSPLSAENVNLHSTEGVDARLSLSD